MGVCALEPPREGDRLIQQVALVREMLGRLETKLREDDPDRIPKEDDQGLRIALHAIGDDRLTQFVLGYAVCVRGLTAPLASGAWKRELAGEVEEAHRRALRRLETVESRARSFLGRLVLRFQAGLGRIVVRSRRSRQPFSPEEDGRHRRPA
jgi:hypothetical protein